MLTIGGAAAHRLHLVLQLPQARQDAHVLARLSLQLVHAAHQRTVLQGELSHLIWQTQ